MASYRSETYINAKQNVYNIYLAVIRVDSQWAPSRSKVLIDCSFMIKLIVVSLSFIPTLLKIIFKTIAYKGGDIEKDLLAVLTSPRSTWKILVVQTCLKHVYNTYRWYLPKYSHG